MRAAVVVLGDLGRSPRMLFHARALAAEGLDVDLIGSGESALPTFITDNARIAVHTIRDRRHRAAGGTWSFPGALVRGTRLIVALTRLLLWRIPPPDLILVQNPPGVPTLAIAWLAARARSARFAIDWHNRTSAMLALRLGPGHPAVHWVARFEGLSGRAADVNLFVSSHMRDRLHQDYGITGTVFRDRPADCFAPLPDAQRRRVRQAIFGKTFEQAAREPALLISPTSWSADEDLALFLDALEKYDASAQHGSNTDGLPPIVVLITGRGPLRQAFENRVARTSLTSVTVRTAWLEPAEYPRVLAAADLGMSFHASASRLDLPMKIADMFGAGVPVCAYDYGPCLGEIVHEGVNGVLFTTADECQLHLEHLLRGFPGQNSALQQLKDGVAHSTRSTWADGWAADARPVLLGAMSDGTRKGSSVRR